jgi:hypothetical protein
MASITSIHGTAGPYFGRDVEDRGDKSPNAGNCVLNFWLDGVSLCREVTKPFETLVKGLLVPSNRNSKN